MADIKVLDEILSARIAAGEVIERPQSVLRELLDNSLDSAADEISISLEGGGVDLIEVEDNGNGIKRSDLDNIARRHSTSKISKLDDLYAISTLGFRGEALYSIASVSSLTIESKTKDEDIGYTININNGRRGDIIGKAMNNGTKIIVKDLFLEIPARRSFLKRSSTESQMARNLLVQKALSFPRVKFSLRIDGALRLEMPKVDSLKERVMHIYRNEGIAEADVNTLKCIENDYSIEIVAANSAHSRNDKREIRIYVNKRPIDDYAITQAVIYGFGELIPGGRYPYAAVFIEDRPELVDFNIHPAKREAKLRNRADIHHSITTLLRNVERVIPEADPVQGSFYLTNAKRWEDGKRIDSYYTRESESERESREVNEPPRSPEKSFKEKEESWIEKAKELQRLRLERDKDKGSYRESKKINADTENKEEMELPFRYIGQAFKLFLIAEKGNELYLVDQHAAHERIIYDELIEKKTVQRLLIPIDLEVEREIDEFLMSHKSVYENLGIMLERKKECRWSIYALPQACKGLEDEITSYIQKANADEKEIEMETFAIIACKSAIKGGDEVDKYTANAILEKVFKMEEPCCPHGRTFLVKLSESHLRKLVGRDV